MPYHGPYQEPITCLLQRLLTGQVKVRTTVEQPGLAATTSSQNYIVLSPQKNAVIAVSIDKKEDNDFGFCIPVGRAPSLVGTRPSKVNLIA